MKRIIKINLLIVFVIFSSCYFSCYSLYNRQHYIYSDTPSEYGMLITRNNISWYFEEDYEHGQFANGDWWVVGPVRIIYIYPPSVRAGGSRVINGSMVNPDPTVNIQGFDSSSYMPYSAAANYALDISSSKPLVLPVNSSLISSISTPEPGANCAITDAEILTVLSAAPSNGSFRPPYCTSDKTIRFNISQLDYSYLQTLTPVAGAPAMSDVVDYFERPWLDFNSTAHQPAIHPSNNMPDYGRDIAARMGIGMLMLHLNFTNAQKETLLIRLVQIGIDNYGVVQAGGEWTNDGGLSCGRKWPILFAGIVLHDTDMRNIGQNSGDYLYSGSYYETNIPSDYIHFAEDDQTFYVTQRDIDRNIGYTSSHLGMPEWGITHTGSPNMDNPSWSASYRMTNVVGWGGFVLAARMMEGTAGAMTLWNHDALFDFIDRAYAITRGDDDGWTVPNEAISNFAYYPEFVTAMWDMYRSSF